MNRKCNQCGQDVGYDDLYCINCGVLLENNEKNHRERNEHSTPPKGGPYAPLSLGDYLLIGLILMIPVVNIIVLLIWALDKHSNLNRRNLAKAGLIYLGVCIGLTIVFGIGMFRAVTLDQRIYPEEKYYEYYIEHPDFDEWMQLPYSTDET
ncbi:hypothetical protein [Anaerotignum sp.]|uniref:hypothetical protein n=1 Tax=Anaerotignum sp. TaxID=2039241 RepID=UPI0028B062A3|nr:hypothetical protein [Anaerotignum sp.]